MNLRFIADGPALLVSNRQRILAVADLHIGIEAELAARGWHVASRTGERLERLLSCIESSDPDLLLLLGDIKHNLPRTTVQEYRELPAFLDRVRKHVPIRVLPGNHDTAISRFIDPEEFLDRTGAVVDGTGYLHGHTMLSPSLRGRLVVAGHHHPLVSIRDQVGCALRSPAYLLAALDPSHLFTRSPGKNTAAREGRRPRGKTITRALLMPAFNECAGFDVTNIVLHPFSPVSRAIRAKSAEVILPDGTYIGPVSSLEDDAGAAA